MWESLTVFDRPQPTFLWRIMDGKAHVDYVSRIRLEGEYLIFVKIMENKSIESLIGEFG